IVVNNTSDTGSGSLRQAILDANSTTGGQTIVFAIPGSGVQTISPLSALPAINVPVTIDGTTQQGYVGTPLIELKGPGSKGAAFDGITIQASGSTVRGLVIDSFNGSGIVIQANNVVIAGNLIGTNALGITGLGNSEGVLVKSASSNNTIGSTSAATGN